MLDIVDTSLRSVDVFVADFQPLNAMMILLGIELSDLDLFSVNGTLGANPLHRSMRKKMEPIESTKHSTSLRDHDSKDSKDVITKSMREKEQDRMRQRFVC